MRNYGQSDNIHVTKTLQKRPDKMLSNVVRRNASWMDLVAQREEDGKPQPLPPPRNLPQLLNAKTYITTILTKNQNKLCNKIITNLPSVTTLSKTTKVLGEGRENQAYHVYTN